MPQGVLETQLHTVGDGSSQKRQMEQREEARKQKLQLHFELSSFPPFQTAHEILGLLIACSFLKLKAWSYYQERKSSFLRDATFNFAI